jgi:hypothetical protein
MQDWEGKEKLRSPVLPAVLESAAAEEAIHSGEPTQHLNHHEF